MEATIRGVAGRASKSQVAWLPVDPGRAKKTWVSSEAKFRAMTD